MKHWLLGLGFWALAATSALAISEANFEKEYEQYVKPFFTSLKDGRLAAEDNASLYYTYALAPNAKATIVIVHGYTESHLKYEELLYDFSKAGYSVFLLDHRGMGLSGRWLKNPQIVDIDNFDRYYKDQLLFIDTVVKPTTNAPTLFLFGHSLGGLVVAQLLAARPGDFKKAAVTSPSLQFHTGKYPETLAYYLTGLLNFVGMKEKYAFGFSDYDPATASFEQNRSMQSRVRFEHYRKILEQNPSVVMGGPSSRWVHLGIRTTQNITELGKPRKTPLLLYSVEGDTYVKPEGQKAYCTAAPDCQWILLKSAKHDVMRGSDSVRTPVLNQILSFFEEKA